MRTLLRNATLITQNAQRDVLRGDIILHDDCIESVGLNTTDPSYFDTVIDCTDRFVLPGFVQAHVHLCQTHLRNCGDDRELLPWLREVVWPGEAGHTPETLYSTSRLAINELIAGGTTTVLTMETVRHTDSAVQAVSDGGIRAILGKALMDRDAGQPSTLREETMQALADADRLYTQYHGFAKGRIGICYAPRFVPTCSETLLTGIRDRASERNAIIHTHASENRAEIALVKELTGYDNIEYLERIGLLTSRTCLAHCIHLATEDFARLGSNGVHLLHCPGSNLKLGSGIAPIAEARAAGINIAIGADGAPCNNNLDALYEARLMPLLQSIRHTPGIVTAQHALDAITIDSARALGLDTQIGSLEVGKKADVIIIDPTHPHAVGGSDPVSRLIYSCRASDVTHAWIDGNLVFQA